jgi:hypothetical protein
MLVPHPQPAISVPSLTKLQEQQRSIASQLWGGAAVAASAALLLLGPLALDAHAVSGGGGISTPLDGQDLSNQVNNMKSNIAVEPATGTRGVEFRLLLVCVSMS